jgi:hypothetical protein
LQEIIKEEVGVHILLLRRSLFGDDILRALLRRVSATKLISAASQPSPTPD